MPRTARRAAVAALTALAACAAIIAADFTPPAQAQSDDETSGRIVARRLDDGRVEFGWQPTGGERVLPRQRYFPNDITHNRWLRSSPIEVDGAEIGRINARQLSDGRIEFAFTPTDGERIAPQARYFPADARVGRWLRSTEIAIGPPVASYIAVSAGYAHNCAIRESGEIACWGHSWVGQTDAPEGSYTAVSVGGAHNCAIRESDGAIECWGGNDYGEIDTPEGSYIAVSAGTRAHTCAIRESDGAIECWGDNRQEVWDPETETWEFFEAGQIDAPEGSYTAISAGDAHTCAIRTSGEIECWGWNTDGRADAPEGSYIAVSAGYSHTCAIRESGEITCWGEYWPAGQTDAPEGSYIAVSTTLGRNCAIRESGEITCWGRNDYGALNAPAGSFTAVSVGHSHNCGLRTSGAIACWGKNDDGQATPPAD